MYIRLLAGKFGPICTEYPLATFSAKILTRLPSKNFPLKNTASRAKNRKVKANLSSLRKKKSIHCKQFHVFSIKRNPYSTCLSLNLFLYFNSLHEMMCGSSLRKSIMANYRAFNHKYKIHVLGCDQCVFKTRHIFVKLYVAMMSSSE